MIGCGVGGEVRGIAVAIVTALALVSFTPLPAVSQKAGDPAAARRPSEPFIAFRWAFGALSGSVGAPSLIAVKPEATLTSGDKFKMMVEMRTKCFLYVVYHNSQGEVSLLFPYSLDQFGKDYTTAKRYFIPRGEAWFELDGHAGRETFYLMASSRRLIDVEYLFKQYEAAAPLKKRALARQVLAEIQNLKWENREITALLDERPVEPPPARGVERSQGADPSDISVIADEIEATGFFSRTFTIIHK